MCASNSQIVASTDGSMLRLCVGEDAVAGVLSVDSRGQELWGRLSRTTNPLMGVQRRPSGLVNLD